LIEKRISVWCVTPSHQATRQELRQQHLPA
jgi:hypothetical protein